MWLTTHSFAKIKRQYIHTASNANETLKSSIDKETDNRTKKRNHLKTAEEKSST